MDIMEIILLIAGGLILVLSFFIPEKKEGGAGALAEDEVKLLVEQELNSVRSHVDDVVEEAVTYAMEKTERSLERLSNEKIMAVNEYSETVLAEIHKNHEEVMFLYDMLNNKHTSLKGAISEINRAVKEAEEMHGILQELASAVPAEDRAEEAAAPLVEKGIEKPEVPTAELREGPFVMDQEEIVRELDNNASNNKEKIMELYKSGKSAVMIAKELELGTGEVKLVIDLYKDQ